jgi:hypothetical protein
VTTVADGVACQSSRTLSRDKTKQANDGVASPVDIEAEFDRFAAAMMQLAARQADGRGRRPPSDGKRRGPQPSISAETIYEHTSDNAARPLRPSRQHQRTLAPPQKSSSAVEGLLGCS